MKRGAIYQSTSLTPRDVSRSGNSCADLRFTTAREGVDTPGQHAEAEPWVVLGLAGS